MEILVAIAVLAFFVWLLIPTAATAKPSDEAGAPFIDPDDSPQIGVVLGLIQHIS